MRIHFPECLLSHDREDGYWTLRVLSEWTGSWFPFRFFNENERNWTLELQGWVFSSPRQSKLLSLGSHQPCSSLQGLFWDIWRRSLCLQDVFACLPPPLLKAGACFCLLHLCIFCSECRSFQEKSVEWTWAIMAKLTLNGWHHLRAVRMLPHARHGAMAPAAGRKGRLSISFTKYTFCLSFTKYRPFPHNFPLPNDFSRAFLHWNSLKPFSFYSFCKELSGKYFKLYDFCPAALRKLWR